MVFRGSGLAVEITTMPERVMRVRKREQRGEVKEGARS